MTQVTVNIYDVVGGTVFDALNGMLLAMGTGAFHSGVVVYGIEWSFGYCETGSGVMLHEPKASPHQYRMSLNMGETRLSDWEVVSVIERLRKEWVGSSYNLLHRNCCAFAAEFCRELGLGCLPAWVTNLAAAGAAVHSGFTHVTSGAQNAAVVAANKASFCVGAIASPLKMLASLDPDKLMLAGAMHCMCRSLSHSFQGRAALCASPAGDLPLLRVELDETCDVDDPGDGEEQCREVDASMCPSGFASGMVCDGASCCDSEVPLEAFLGNLTLSELVTHSEAVLETTNWCDDIRTCALRRRESIECDTINVEEHLRGQVSDHVDGSERSKKISGRKKPWTLISKALKKVARLRARPAPA